MSDSVRLAIQDGLATVTLAQAQRGNPFDGDFIQGMRAACLQLGDAEGLRGVLIRAEGPNFSVGGDLKTFYPQRSNLPPTVRA